MSDHTEVIDRYIAVWNETDDGRRRDLVARTFTDDASYIDPHREGRGIAGIDAMIRGVQEQFPGYRFRRAARIDQHHDTVRFSWLALPQTGPVFAVGTDVATIAGDGRMRSVTGFVDQMAAPQS